MRYLVNDTRMIAIADAIRSKLNIEDLMTIDQMPDLIMRIETIAKPVMISFYINGNKYQAEKNMTLQEWCNSQYNIDDYILNNNGIWDYSEEYYNELYNINNITIIENNMSIDLIKYNPMINYTITTISNSTNSFTCELGTTWENFIGTRVGDHPGTLTEDEYGNLQVAEDTSPEEIQSRINRNYPYHLVDANNNKVHKNDIITSQNYHFEYLKFKVDEYPYDFDYGMTLGEWCNSEYNVDNYILKADGFWNSNEEYYNESYNINNNTVIESNMSIDLIKYIPMINYSISPIRDEDDLYLTCASNATWESMLGIQIAEYSDPLEEDEYGNLYVYETIPPDKIQSRFIRQYTYHLVDENNNKVHKNDIITSQNYHFEYLIFTMTGAFGAEYNFDYGMTLEEWCNSEYNTDGWWADDTGITNLDYMSYEVNKNTVLESNMTINTERFCCFTKGTQITTSLNGDTQPIEALKEGGLVVSYNINTKENYYTKIKKLITNPYSISMAKVYLDNGTILEMTNYHPLYTIEGFKSITDKKYPELKVGDILPTFDNKETIITNIELYKNEKPITTYTLNVINLDENIDDDTTDNYYANGIIAHNSAGCEL